MKRFVTVLILIVAAITVLAFLPGNNRHRGPIKDLPWQIQLLPNGGSRVFGLTLDHSTLADARRHFGDDMELAVIAGHGEKGSLEAYYHEVNAGVLTGKMVLATSVDAATLAQLKRNAAKTEVMDTGAMKYVVSNEDRPRAYDAPITSITFIPSVNLDEKIAQRRFGTPASRISGGKYSVHLLYPDKGVDLILTDKGKDILQYVAPRHFDRLRKPLEHAMEIRRNTPQPAK
ncbi:MAG: hypothetical protein P8076_05100 [Gammaproteobacteria bacterium]